ncbi:energy-coupling factor transporter transmembrane component T family protein [Fructilactobacillus cliffordii]|uniref:Energy-coupling factor transporter transmembrane protein EcfT n=1 Tax=Fructilactobacillus cliffordii TaxID=2940299 RepID=A0A9Q8ZVA8_9LACO|nr:energy-coupling factor transporter transmembrane component T [Fructilactobacillus cliffordii]USS89171.1 energy-coupling factor transporter transmembrane protein EcfT [Fructilactobacillus cliffordii]
MAPHRDNWVRQLTPGTQLMSILLGLLAVFLNQKLGLAFLLLLGSFGLVKLAGFSMRRFLRRIRLFVFFLILTAFFQLLLVHTGPILWQWGILQVTAGSLLAALLLLVKFGTALVVLNLLTLIANPVAMTAACERGLAPLQKVGIPVGDVALTLSIAFRFVPTLTNEFQTVTAAQQARGITYRTGPLKQRTQALLAVFLPVLVNSFRRAEDLAAAMLLRGYDGKHRLPQYLVPQRTSWDWFTLGTSLLLLVLIVGINYL